MAINVSFNELKIGGMYTRDSLTSLWGYQARQAISRGVVTPANSNVIVFFVTKDKKQSATQYEDYITDNYLYWEGEKEGGNNNRIINAARNGDSIHLFYRYKHQNFEFEYKGTIQFITTVPVKDNAPLKFIFKLSEDIDQEQNQFREPETLYSTKDTTKLTLALSRIGQGKFRVDLLDMWDACSLTNVNVPEILKASHIKPWKESTNFERLDPHNGLILTPTLDSLFDGGFITFKNTGQILISKEIEPYSKILNVSENMKLRKHFEKNNQYLEYHRDIIYSKRFKL